MSTCKATGAGLKSWRVYYVSGSTPGLLSFSFDSLLCDGGKGHIGPHAMQIKMMDSRGRKDLVVAVEWST